jgi:hypothetical protein
MHVLFDQRSTQVKRIGDASVGTVVVARGPSRSAVGVILKDQSEGYASRYLLTSDDAGPHVPGQGFSFVVEFGAADDLRVIVSEPLDGRGPGKPDEAVGLLGFDSTGAFVIIDARQRTREMTLSTVCLNAWSLSYGTADRAYRADIFFRRWEIVMVDSFGRRDPILNGGKGASSA